MPVISLEKSQWEAVHGRTSYRCLQRNRCRLDCSWHSQHNRKEFSSTCCWCPGICFACRLQVLRLHHNQMLDVHHLAAYSEIQPPLPDDCKTEGKSSSSTLCSLGLVSIGRQDDNHLFRTKCARLHYQNMRAWPQNSKKHAKKWRIRATDMYVTNVATSRNFVNKSASPKRHMEHLRHYTHTLTRSEEYTCTSAMLKASRKSYQDWQIREIQTHNTNNTWIWENRNRTRSMRQTVEIFLHHYGKKRNFELHSCYRTQVHVAGLFRAQRNRRIRYPFLRIRKIHKSLL